MKNFLWAFAGLVVGCLATNFYLKQTTNPEEPSLADKNGSPASREAFTVDTKVLRRLSGTVDPVVAQNMQTAYLNSALSLRFTYHDPLHAGAVTLATFKGFSLDAKNVQDVINQAGCTKLYIALGIRDTVFPQSTVKDQIFTSILYGLKPDNTTVSTTNPFPYTVIGGASQVIVDYSDPCPPYCPK